MQNLLSRLYHTWRYRRRIVQQNFKAKTVAEIFTETYQNRYWKSRESVSGAGAEMAQTRVLREALPTLLREFKVKTLLDLPCGDFNWMQHVDLRGIRYTGGDIVEELVQQNRQRFGNADRSFVCLDILADPLPDADLVLIRDCLVHFSFAHIEQALANIRRSNIRYLLTTSFPDRDQNEDIQTGYWRPLNLQKAPFSFPAPLICLNEKCTEAKGAFADKSLCLWEQSQI
jgi:SAM-dependent methyltransferase